MTIASYSDLQTAIGTWSHRNDTSAIAPDLITLAESRLYDMMILRDMETESTLSGSQASATVALPSGYVSPITLWIILTSSGHNYREELKPCRPEQLPHWPNQAQPQFWAVDGDNIRFDSPLDAGYSLPFRFVQKSNLSNSVTTNYLLAQRPDIYLAACMVELGVYTRDTDMAAFWEPKLQNAIKEFKTRENRNKLIAPLRTDIALSSPRQTFNIYRGE